MLYNNIVKYFFLFSFIVFLSACDGNMQNSQDILNNTSKNAGVVTSCDSDNVFRPTKWVILKEQRVFLWDVSESLGDGKGGNNLWKPLQNNLIDAIKSIPVNPHNKIVLIPFYSNPQTPIEAYATEEGKDSIVKAIKNKGAKPVSDVSLGGKQYTNIAAAIDAFHRLAKPGYKNYMFLYTDGIQENSTGQPCQKILEGELAKWESNSSAKIKKFGFYYLVHSKADNPYIHATENRHDNFWVIDKSDVSIKIIGFPDEYPYNVYAKDTLDNGNLLLGITGDYREFCNKIKLTAEDSLYNLVFTPNVKNGWVRVKVTPKRNDIDEGEHLIKVSVGKEDTVDPYSIIETPTFIIRCINKREHSSDVSLMMESQKDNIGRTSYYPNFCFGLSEEKIVSQKAVLHIKYNIFAERKKCAFDISFVDEDKQPLKYNEFTIVAGGDTLSLENPSIHITGTKIIPLEFIPSAKTTDKHYAGYIVFSNTSDMDRINGTETMSGERVISEWNFKHDKKWNPLLILLLTVLVLWIVYVVIRRLYREGKPRFKRNGQINFDNTIVFQNPDGDFVVKDRVISSNSCNLHINQLNIVPVNKIIIQRDVQCRQLDSKWHGLTLIMNATIPNTIRSIHIEPSLFHLAKVIIFYNDNSKKTLSIDYKNAEFVYSIPDTDNYIITHL